MLQQNFYLLYISNFQNTNIRNNGTSLDTPKQKEDAGDIKNEPWKRM